MHSADRQCLQAKARLFQIASQRRGEERTESCRHRACPLTVGSEGRCGPGRQIKAGCPPHPECEEEEEEEEELKGAAQGAKPSHAQEARGLRHNANFILCCRPFHLETPAAFPSLPNALP